MMNTFFSRRDHSRRHTSPPVGHLPPRSGHRRDRPPSRASETPAETSLAGSLASALFAIPFVLVIGLLFLLIGTLVTYRSADPHALIAPLSLAALGLTSLMGGLISARRRRGHPLLSGLLCGLLINLLLLAVSLVFRSDSASVGYSPLIRWGLHAAIVVLAVLGARLGMGRRR